MIIAAGQLMGEKAAAVSFAVAACTVYYRRHDDTRSVSLGIVSLKIITIIWPPVHMPSGIAVATAGYQPSDFLELSKDEPV